VIEEAARFVDINAQIFDMMFWYDGGIHDSEGRMRGETDVFVFAVEGEVVSCRRCPEHHWQYGRKCQVVCNMRQDTS